LTKGQTATVSISTSEPTTNLTAGDIQAGNGSISNFSGSGTSYSAKFTPATEFNGQGHVKIAATAFTDALRGKRGQTGSLTKSGSAHW
jgi:hypothetical protein